MSKNRKLFFGCLAVYITDMIHYQDDFVTQGPVTAKLATDQLRNVTDRHGDKPVIVRWKPEIAHPDAPEVIDLRIARTGWLQTMEDFGDGPPSGAIRPALTGSSLILCSATDLDRFGRPLAVAMQPTPHR